MEKFIIYKSTNILNDKVYIGFTSKTLKERIRTHKYRCSSGVSVNFYNSVRKYGWDNFVFEELYTTLDGNYCLNTMESHFIKEYDSYKNGLNDTKGGNGLIGYWNVENKKKQSDFIKSLWTEERRRKNGLLAKKRMKGIPKTKQHIEKLKGKRPQFNQTGGKNNNAKPISTPYGIFDSMKTTHRELNKMGIEITYRQISYKLSRNNHNDWNYIVGSN